jgi:adenylate cyclase
VRVSRFYRRSVLLAGVVVVAVVLALGAVHGLRGLDLSSIDSRFGIRGSQGPPSEVVVVGIDAATFSYLDAHHPGEAHFPFARRLDARVISNLAHAGARVIAYDEQFTEPTDPTDDNALILAVRAAGNVVLATTAVAPGGRTDIFGGGQALAFSRATPADGQFPVDPDGRIRRMRAQILDLVTFPVAVAELARGRPVRFPGGRNASAYIDFRGPSGTVREISYWRVLEGQFPAGTFRGKIVVVGATEPILHDIHSTSTDVLMTGSEVQANAIDTVLRGFPLRPAPGWLNVALVIVLGLGAPLLALRFGALRTAGLALAALALLALGCQLTFDGGRIVGFVYPALAVLLSASAVLVLQGMRVAFERERVYELFSRFVPDSVVKQVVADADGARLGGVARDTTVMFTDLRGFTSFSSQHEPQLVIDVVNRYLGEMSEAIFAAGGTLVSYTGDGIFAIFGAPIEMPDHADRALTAALEMICERLPRFNERLREMGLKADFRMGVGLNSGPVISGNIGSERRLEYTAIGDTVNLAARIEAATKDTQYMLLLADSTQKHLTDAPDGIKFVKNLELRGASRALRLWTVAGTEGARTEFTQASLPATAAAMLTPAAAGDPAISAPPQATGDQ